MKKRKKTKKLKKILLKRVSESINKCIDKHDEDSKSEGLLKKGMNKIKSAGRKCVKCYHTLKEKLEKNAEAELLGDEPLDNEPKIVIKGNNIPEQVNKTTNSQEEVIVKKDSLPRSALQMDTTKRNYIVDKEMFAKLQKLYEAKGPEVFASKPISEDTREQLLREAESLEGIGYSNYIPESTMKNDATEQVIDNNSSETKRIDDLIEQSEKKIVEAMKQISYELAYVGLETGTDGDIDTRKLLKQANEEFIKSFEGLTLEEKVELIKKRR